MDLTYCMQSEHISKQEVFSSICLLIKAIFIKIPPLVEMMLGEASSSFYIPVAGQC